MLVVDQYHSTLLVNLSCFLLSTKPKGINIKIKVSYVLPLSVVWLLLQSISLAVYVGIVAIEKPGGYIDLVASNTHTVTMVGPVCVKGAAPCPPLPTPIGIRWHCNAVQIVKMHPGAHQHTFCSHLKMCFEQKFRLKYA